MTTVNVKKVYGESAELMWHRIGDPGALADWHPAVKETALMDEGWTRVNTLVGGGKVVEPILERTGQRYTFRIEEGPFPFSDFVSTLAIREGASKGCVVEWRATFVPSAVSEAEASELVRGFFQAGLDSLEGAR